MQKVVLSIFLFISIISASYGQDVKVTSTFDSTKIFIGDQIKFTITVDKPAGLKLRLPVLKDTITKKIDIISGPKTDSISAQNGRIKIIQKYLVTSFDSGRYQVKPVYAETKTDAGLKRFYSDYSVLEVMRVKIAPADTAAKIFDIVQPYRAPLTVAEILPWLLVLIVAAGAVWGAIRYIRSHRKTEDQSAIYVPADPAHVIAYRELSALKSEELWQKGETKKYYTRLTEILRLYLENRFRVYSLEMTTSETLEELARTGFKRDASYNELKSVLTGADMVKFAKYNPVAEENEEHFNTAWKFVDNTKLEEAAVAPLEPVNSGKEAVQ